MRQGRILAGKYRLICKLTEGGMGMVWRAEHIELGTPAAVKLLDPTIAESAEALARFKREAQSAASLRSSNIVQIFDFGVDETLPYIAMELLEGKSLAEKLRSEGPMSPVDTAAVLAQVARAAAWAHSRGIVHRDLKPGNIFLSEDAGDIVVKLLDFGIAKPVHLDLSETPVTLTGAIMGTPQYMSPEQASGKKVVDHRTDIWSFAIIAFECLTGKHVFRADTLGGLVLAICTEPLLKPSEVAAVPPGFDEWFAHAAARNLEERFSTISEASDTLRFVCGADCTGSQRFSTYDGPIGSDLRSINTPGRGIPNTPWDHRHTTADTPSTTTVRSVLPLSRRAQLFWIFGVLLVALAAIGSVLRFQLGPNTTSRASAAPTEKATVAPNVSSSSPVAPLPEPTAGAVKTAPAPSHKPPQGNPTPKPVVTKPPHVFTASLVPSVSVPADQCDPKVKNRIGICPPPGK